MDTNPFDQFKDFDENSSSNSQENESSSMENPFSQFAEFDNNSDELVQDQNKGFNGDLVTSLKKGVLGIPGIATGLADIIPAITIGERPFDKATDFIGDATGFKPSQWAEDLNKEYSPKHKQQQIDVNNVWEDPNKSGLDIAKTYLKNPGIIANQVVESTPSMLLGGAISRAGMVAGSALPIAEGVATKTLPMATGYLERKFGRKAAAAIAGGLGEGIIQTGQALDQSTGEDQRKNAFAALASGAVDAIIGGFVGKAAQSFGVDTAETLMAKGFTKNITKELSLGKTALSKTGKIAAGAASEGLLQEFPQSAQEQMFQNYASGKSIWEGVNRAAIEGALAGVVMGAGANVISTQNNSTGSLNESTNKVTQKTALAKQAENILSQDENQINQNLQTLNEQIILNNESLADYDLLDQHAKELGISHIKLIKQLLTENSNTQKLITIVNKGIKKQINKLSPEEKKLTELKEQKRIADEKALQPFYDDAKATATDNFINNIIDEQSNLAQDTVIRNRQQKFNQLKENAQKVPEDVETRQRRIAFEELQAQNKAEQEQRQIDSNLQGFENRRRSTIEESANILTQNEPSLDDQAFLSEQQTINNEQQIRDVLEQIKQETDPVIRKNLADDLLATTGIKDAQESANVFDEATLITNAGTPYKSKQYLAGLISEQPNNENYDIIEIDGGFIGVPKIISADQDGIKRLYEDKAKSAKELSTFINEQQVPNRKQAVLPENIQQRVDENNTQINNLLQESLLETDIQTKQNLLKHINRLHGENEQLIIPFGSAPQFQTTDQQTFNKLSLTEIESMFPQQEVIQDTDGIINIKFKNGQGVSFKSIQDAGQGFIKIAIETGQMSKDGKILGITIGNEVLLDADFADNKTMWHENKHVLDNLGMITVADNSALNKEFNKLRKQNKLDFALSTHEDPKQRMIENRANMFAQIMVNRETYRKTSFNKVIQRIMDFFQQLFAMGQQTVAGLASEVESGKIYERTINDQTYQTTIPQAETIAEKWYSRLENAINSFKAKQAPAKQWKGMVKNFPGIKPEEIEWIGLYNWLDEQSGKVQKKDIINYIQENNVQLEEVVQEVDSDNINSQNIPQYDNYQLPHGENYKELILTLPKKVTLIDTQKMFGKDYEDLTQAEAIQLQQIENFQDKPYKNFHWSGIMNPIAHIRFHERTDADNNKVLLLQEVQSDWHQTGRKEGYGANKLVHDKAKVIANGYGIELELTPSGKISNKTDDLVRREMRKRKEVRFVDDWNLLVDASEFDGVPDAPFKKSWPLLAMKRMVRYAAENGFDKIAWPSTPEQIAQIEGWDKITTEETDKGKSYFIHGSKNVSSIVERYLQDIPRMLNKEFNRGKWGKAKVEQIESNIQEDVKISKEDALKAFKDDEFIFIDDSIAREKSDIENYQGTNITIAKPNKFLSLPITDRMRSKALREGMPYFNIDNIPISQQVLGGLINKKTKTNTKSFKDWFGKSVAKNKHQDPIIFYHGTNEVFEEFKKEPSDKPIHLSANLGHFFTMQKGLAEKYGQHQIKVYLKMEHPYKMSLAEAQSFDTYEASEQRQAELKKQGYDSIIIATGGSPYIVIFDSGQAKSIYNQGDWNDQSNIYFETRENQIFTQDDQGNELIGYHGTLAKPFKNFDDSKIQQYEHGWSGAGHYFTVNKDYAQGYANLTNPDEKNSGRIVKARFSFKNPLYKNSSEYNEILQKVLHTKSILNKKDGFKATEAFKAAGYDAVIDGQSLDKAFEINVFDSKNIHYAPGQAQFQVSNQVTGQTIPQKIYDELFEDRKTLVRSFAQTAQIRLNEVKLLIDKGLGSISTRLANVDPEIPAKLRKLDFTTSQKIISVLKTAKPILDIAKSTMSPEDRHSWNWARLNSDEGKINQLSVKYNLTEHLANLREKLNNIRLDAKDVGYDVGFIDEYWPRVIKDQAGFLEATQGISERAVFTEAFREQAKKLGISQEQFEREFPEVKADIISNLILGKHSGIGGPGNIQSRVFETIPKEYAKFYMDADAALMQYIYSMTKKIEVRRFFGKVPTRISNLKTQRKNKSADILKYTTLADLARANDSNSLTEHEDKIDKLNEDIVLIDQALELYKNQRDYTENIGVYIDQLRASGRILPKDEKMVRDILDARFHEHGTTGIVNAYKNLAYIDTMGSFTSAITQIGDLAWAMYAGKVWTPKGFSDTTKNLTKAIFKKSKVTKEDLGIERIAQEFADGTTLGNAVSKVFKLVGLEQIDSIGKEVLINNALEQYKLEAQQSHIELAKKIKPIFGNKSSEVVQEILADTPSENVKLLLYSRLLDFQPAALSEMPETYLKSGNGRIFYMLKTYTLKQFDVFRREVWNNIKSDNPKVKIQGIKNAIQLMTLLTLANATADEIKDWMLGKETKFSDNVIENFLTIGGASRYTRMQVAREGFGSSLMQQVLPPAKFINSISKDLNEGYNDYVSNDVYKFDNARLIDSIPAAGKLYYWHMGRASELKESINEKEFKKAGKDARLLKKQIANSDDKHLFMLANADRFKQMKLHENYQKSLNKLQAVINKLDKLPSTANIQQRIGQLKNKREQVLERYIKISKSL